MLSESIDPPFTGGLAPGTKVFLSNWKTIPLEEIKIGDEVLTSDGSAARVEAVMTDNDDLVEIRQSTNHHARLSRGKPWGVISMICSKTQQLLLKTTQRIIIFKVKNEHCRKVLISQMVDHQTEEGRVVKTITEIATRFHLTSGLLEIVNHVEAVRLKHEGRCFNWRCEIDDLQYLNKDRRAGSTIIWKPIVIEIPVLETWLKQLFNDDISSRQIDAMAWLLGFCVGDGHRGGPTFAVNTEDLDVYSKLEEYAKLWGMSFKIKPAKRSKATGHFHTYGELHNRKVKNPLVKVLEGLGFCENWSRNGPKSIPLFMRTEKIVVREFFLAGLIDADGSCKIQNKNVRVKIPTVCPSIRDGIYFIGRSLGLDVFTILRDVDFSERSESNESDLWISYLSGGTNDRTLRSILTRCACERKRTPTYCSGGSDSDEYDSEYESSAEERESEHLDLSASEIIQISNNYIEEQEEDTFNFGKLEFDAIPKGRGQVIGLLLAETSDQTFVTDQQIICGSAQVIDQKSEPRKQAKRVCFSCGVEKTARWYKVPWSAAAVRSLCSPCYGSYLRYHTRCSNKACNMVFKDRDLNPKNLKGKQRELALMHINCAELKCKKCGCNPTMK